jgi:hypothetical protein
MYYLIETLSKLSEDETITFFKRLLPMPLKNNISTFLTSMVSFAVSLENKQILTAASLYIDKDQLKLPEDIEYLPVNLAETSPRFASILIDKGYFNIVEDVFTPELLTSWLKSLNQLDTSVNINFSGQTLIRYALFGNCQKCSELHFRILEAIERKRMVSLPNQFIIDLATNLSNRPNDAEKHFMVDRFSQVLFVALQYGIVTKFSNQVKNTLSSLFPDNPLIRTLTTASPTKLK